MLVVCANALLDVVDEVMKEEEELVVSSPIPFGALGLDLPFPLEDEERFASTSAKVARRMKKGVRIVVSFIVSFGML